ncbi:hypothetical protein CVT24_012391 [Panaeolus cyanescens]|uniref:CSC1/OSCA1-like 7TM region domain-containing protein n=1 Tax=Panaeolus cyanescens TaxID=181874 RepID=A0A409YJB3_9AGAR|nr:hypothetical protein CVT24_012391 [Panaeolus cyanescens]
MSVNAAKARQNSTTTAFVTALAVNSALLAVEVGAFLVLKQKLWRIYSPRTILPPPSYACTLQKNERAAQLPTGPWRWIVALVQAPLEDIIHKNGLDAYMFLRYIRLLIIIFFGFTIATFLIVVPTNAVRIIPVNPGLDQIAWTNITDPKDQPRFFAHVIVVYGLTAYVLWLIHKEMTHFVHMRHQFLISKSHSRLPQARTVVISPVPEELATEKDLRTFASFVPGGIDRVWLYRDTKSLNELFERRQEACQKLEAAESEVLKLATKAWRVKQKQFNKIERRRARDAEAGEKETLEMPQPSKEALNDLVPLNLRPKHRTGFLGLIGTKVDTIDWCKEEISTLNKEIAEKRKHIVKGKFLGSAFIRCNLQMGAHVLSQCVSYHEPLKMYNKWMEAHPKDIVWSNLDDGALEMTSRYVISWLATIGLIFVWAFPVGFIGTMSNLTELCSQFHWLEWVCEAPRAARGLIEGVLPPLLLAALFALLPLILQGLAWYECIPRYSLMSVSVYRRFYLFLLIHGFLIVTISSGLTSAVERIVENPTKTVQELSSQLPGASVFFLTYMVTQGLAGAGSALVQLAPLALHFIRKWFLGRTPRQAYDVTFKMPSADFGTILPRLSLLATIAFAYSVLSPLINLLALLCYSMFYIAWKFLFDQVFDQPDEKETGGMYFPMAINNLFTGLYIEQICLTCLFVLKIPESRVNAIIQAVLMFALLVLTACAHIFMNNSYRPLEQFLPMSLATKKMVERYAKKHNLQGVDDQELDLFSRTRIRSVRKRIKATTKKLDSKLEQIKAKVKDVADAIDLSDSDDETKRNTRENAHSKSPTGESTALGTPYHSKGDSEDIRSSGSRKSSSESKRDKKKLVFDDADATDEESDGEHAFDHPSTYVEQSWIWIPKDPLGLSTVLVDELKEVGVEASDVGAVMNERGVVEVTRNPPDEEWKGGHDS